MKIFFSYPHDKNQPFVEKLRIALEEEGHQVWFDDSEVKEGDEWRRKITEGLLDTEATVAFLSKHSVRETSVCLNEVAIAMAEQSEEALITVLLEPEYEVNMPPSVSHIQWLKMDEWEAKEKAQDEAWYRGCVDKLIDIIENPASANRHDELNQLKSVLNPLSFHAERKHHLTNFVGREWLFKEIKDWFQDTNSRRVFHIQGGPGLGKTAIATNLSHQPDLGIIAMYVCRHNFPDSRNVQRFVKTLAYQLASRLPDYRARLLSAPAIQNPEKMAESGYDIWSDLIAERMSGVGGKELIDRQRLAIVIDGLDEATVDGKNEILKLLSERMKDLPNWLTFIFTSRPTHEIKERLSAYNPRVIKGDDPNNIHDLEAYIDKWLNQYVDNDEVAADKKLTKVEKEKTQKIILEKSEGSFLYVIQAREAEKENLLSLKNPDQLPNGLNNIYALFFERRFKETGENSPWQQYAKPLLSYMVISPVTLPLSIARQLLGWNQDDETDNLSGEELERNTIRSLGSLVRQNETEQTLEFFHKSVRDWLQDTEQSGDFFISSRLYHLSALTEIVWIKFVNTQGKCFYGEQVIPQLMTSLQDRNELALNKILGQPETAELSEFLYDFSTYIMSKYRLLDAIKMFTVQISYTKRLLNNVPNNSDYALALNNSYGKMAEIYLRIGNQEIYKKYVLEQHNVLENLIRYHPNENYYILSYITNLLLLGDVELSSRNQDKTQNYFKESHRHMEQLYKSEPDNLEYAGLFNVCLVKLGDCELTFGGSWEKAYYFYEDALELFQELYASDSENIGYATSQIQLLKKLGDMEVRFGDEQRQLNYYKESVKVARNIHNHNPNNVLTAIILVDSLDDLATFRTNLDHHKQALNHYEESIKVLRSIYKEAQEDISLENKLQNTLGKLAKLHMYFSDYPAALKCYEELLNKHKDVCERHPHNLSFAKNLHYNIVKIAELYLDLDNKKQALYYYREANFAFQNIGDIHLRAGERDPARIAYERSHKVFSDFYERSPDNPQYAHDLSVSFIKLGDTDFWNGDYDLAESFYKEAIDILKSLFTRFPDNYDFKRDLDLCYVKLAASTKGAVTKTDA